MSQPPSKAPLVGSEPLNSLGLSLRDLDAILDRIDKAEKPLGSKRIHTRRPFRRASIKLHIEQPGGRSTLVVAGRNLSSRGMCVLHRSYLHVGTECHVDLPLIGGGERSVAGKIIRCAHREGIIHDLGIKFNEPINPNEHDQLETFSKWLPTLEHVDPSELRGSLLVVEESAADARLLRHLLRHTPITITIVGTCEAAMQRAPDGFDAILCDYHVGDGTAAALIGQLQARKITTPIIVATSEYDPTTIAKISRLRANAFISKPLDGSFLIRLLAELFQPKTAPNEGGDNTIAGATLAAVLDDLLGETVKIQSAIAAGDVEAVRRLCVSMKSTAAALNLGTVFGAAEAAITSLHSTMNVDESAAALSMLINACVQAAGRRTQAA